MRISQRINLVNKARTWYFHIMLKPKVLVILGPTATGKSDLAVRLGKKYSGEVISADSRQVYEGLNLGTGKITKKEMKGVPHHLLDVVSPKKVMTVADYKSRAQKVIAEVHSRGKLPILCGGTGFYIQAVIDDIVFPDVPPNPRLRKTLEKLSAEKLFEKLHALDSARAQTLGIENRTKIIRAIEIAQVLGVVPPLKKNSPYSCLQIGLEIPDDTLKERISARLMHRIKKGMVREVTKLHEAGLSWKRMHSLGLEYRYVSLYLQKKISRNEMMDSLTTEIWHYVRRQKTWFKKDKRIQWFSYKDTASIEKAVKIFTR